MARIIQKYDCLLFPTINENYGHVIAETLANSRPVIISRGTTPWDDVHEIAGFSIPLDNPESFALKLDELASLGTEEYEKLIESTATYFTNSTLINSAIDGHKQMLSSIINMYHEENANT